MAMGLINAGSEPDLLLTFPFNQFAIYPGMPGGGFMNSGTMMTPCTGAGSASAVALGRLNGDTNMDWAFTCQGNNNVSVFGGMGGIGGFQMTTFPTCVNPVALKIVDLNGDGLNDIVVACQSSMMHVHLNTGGGAMFSTTPYSTGALSNPVDLAVGQFNSDSLMDLAVLNQNSSEVALFFNQGAGAFGGMLTYAAPAGPRGIAVGDINLDGRDDVVVASPAGIEGGGGHIVRFGRRPPPVVPEGPFTFTTPANTVSVTLTRNGEGIGTDTVLTMPASAGAQTIALPLTSTLAPARLAPSGQIVSWEVTSNLRTAASGPAEGSARMGSYFYRRQ
jgi:hypothetical protein